MSPDSGASEVDTFGASCGSEADSAATFSWFEADSAAAS
jgi:hypothetical protein